MISNRMKNLHPYVPGEQPKDRVYINLMQMKIRIRRTLKLFRRFLIL
ncbi:MAG: hypothetical protein L6V86_07290 [Treponema sp.]|nr:MAG: hypothetical protein L6V86_07290 [Treponema sp.]